MSAGGPPAVPPELLEAMSRGRAQLRGRHCDGAPGPEICEGLSDLADQAVRALCQRATAGQRPPQIIAIGGYGRQALSPASDLDLLFLTPKPVKEGHREPVVDAVLHGLWDLRYKVGFATRTLNQTLDFALEDLNTLTALLSPRGITEGAEEGAEEIRAGLRQRLSGSRINGTIEALQEAVAERHERFGGSVYLLEPNLKHSPGGLRDLQTILWAAILRFRIRGWADCLPRGVLSPQEAKALFSARRFILRARNALAYAHPHAADRLTFRHQETVATALGFSDEAGGVEAFMASWYRHATEVKRQGARIVERCLEMGQRTRRVSPRPVGDHFRVFKGQLTVAEPDLLQREPAQAMRLFQVAMEQGVPVYGSAKTRAMEIAARLAGPDGDGWRTDPQAVEAFKAILCDPEDHHDALGDLHEVGLLGAMLPEFGAITHRTHHDLYHVYTVDIHTLHAIRKLKALHRGDLAEQEPLLTEAMTSIKSPRSLYIGLLMHDAGKALGRGHAVKGARLIPAVARRLSLSARAAREAEWLVRDHLLMAHISQRRDLDDEHIIQRFARRVGNEEALSKLFILTWADASTTGPQAYTDWKAALLAQLYLRTRQQLGAGLGLFDDPERRVARLRRVVSAALERRGQVVLKDVNGEVDAFFESLPTLYFRRTLARDIVRHYEMLLALKAAPPVALQVDERPRGDLCRVHILAPDERGLLADIAGVLTAHRLKILGAALNSTDDGVALDVFEIQPPPGEVIPDEAWAAIRDDLAAVREGRQTVERLLAGRDGASVGPRPGRRPSATPDLEVMVDAEASRDYTVIDIKAPDRVGLLYAITRAVSEAGVGIYLAKVSTEGDSALDTFYLHEDGGGPLSVERAAEISAALLAVLSPSS